MDDAALDQLETQARADTLPLEGEVVGPEQPKGPDPVAETAAALTVCVMMLSPMLPYLPAIYDEPTIGRIAAAYVPVAEKYGWSASGWLTRFGPEVALAAAVLPTIPPLMKAHRAMMAQREKEAADAAKAESQSAEGAEPGPAPGATDGTLRPV